MRRYLENARPRALVAALAVTLSCIWGLNLARNVYDTTKVENMTQQMKTMCVGRFLIDLPADAQVRFGEAFLAGWDISTYTAETDEQFANRLTKTETDLKGAKNEHGRNSLESANEVSQDGFQGKIFEFEREWTTLIRNGKNVTIEDVSVNGHVRANGLSFDFIAKGTWPGHSKRLAEIVSQLKPLAADEIPSEPGFCIERGVIRDPLTADQRERVTIFVGIADHPDIAIVLDTAAGLNPSGSLLARADQGSTRRQFPSFFHTIRRGERTLAGIPGEEILDKVSERTGTAGHKFRWESFGEKNNVLRPELSLMLGSGHGPRAGSKPVNSSLRDDAILALWDKISSSLRVRPTKAAKPAAAAVPPPPPLGTVVLANQACPASGWWRCGDDDVDVQGGAVQYLRVGERVPQTVLLVPQTLWQRVRGKRSTFQRSMASHWTLVNHRQRRRVATAGPQAVAPADVDDERTPAPVGTLAASGRPCPESGWWLCADAEALDPGARWFGRGETLPSTWFKARRSWFERLKGRPAAMRCPTTWKLARRANMPELPPNDINETET